ncbi:helix-turn-helix domain-containing protein [Streptomyces sp. 3N207]|uniref:helix-turn-helix domain-containing protein n=1 Tax=Streptomyces sp. 3N207 TaxID=3457417 RepID=UPI003FCFBF4D
MGRRENPIGECGKSLYTLAAWLRAGREATGLTYHQLAARTDVSADTLARAASGRSVPQKLSVVLAYAQACDLNLKDAERLWKQARRDEARAQGVLSGHRTGVHISVVKDFADLHSAIVDLYRDDGCPPLRSLDARLGGVGRLPHSTVGRVLSGRSKPSQSFVLAFALVCGVRKSDLAEWSKAWDRADHNRRRTRTQPRHTEQHSPQDHNIQDRLTTHSPATPRDLQVLMSDLESTTHKAPGLKLMVHFPESRSPEAHQAVRRTRELLIDQAQRRGELACPRCGCLSFGYNDPDGWKAALCAQCSRDTATPHSPPAAQALPGDCDTPTLSLRLPAAPPPLPRRIPSRAWPPAGEPAQKQALDANSLPTVEEGTPSVPADSVTASGSCCARPDCYGVPSVSTENAAAPVPETTLTTRIRISIPGARPSPPRFPPPRRPFDWPPPQTPRP